MSVPVLKSPGALRVGRGNVSEVFTLPDPAPWMKDALCAQVDPELFFPERGGTALPAVEVCLDCPVLAECREFALRTGQEFGVWGAMSALQRRQVKSRQLVVSGVLDAVAERVRRLTEAGLPARLIAQRLGITPRSVTRARARVAAARLREAS